MSITIPYKFAPRAYQLPLLKYLDSGGKRAVWSVHRRAGKDKTCFNYMIKRAIQTRGIYYYFLPTYTQAKKVIWDGIDKNGFKFLDHIPPEILKRKNDTELKIELVNGSIIQLVGTDRYDLVMGTNPIGIIFSEYALQNPVVWDYVRPILTENGGWVIFQGTPRGENHFYDLFEMAKNNPEWFAQKLTVEDTKALDITDIDRERREGMPEEMIQQEYYVSFSAAAVGSYYGTYITQAENEGRITDIPHETDHLVYVSWDIGVGDNMSLWFYQAVGNKINIIDCYENSGKGLEWYAKVLEEKPYTYGKHFMPHDASARQKNERATTVKDIAMSLGIKPIEIVPRVGVDDGIQKVRSLFPRMWFDKEKCKDGLKALKNYHREYDEVKHRYNDNPYHDWSSDYCLVAGTKVKTINGEMSIEDIEVNDYVDINGTKAKVLNAGIRRFGKTIKVVLKSGKYIECSPEHKIFTSRGLVYADDLRYNDCVYTLNNPLCKLNNSSERGIRDEFILNMMELSSGTGKKEDYIVHNKIINKSFYIDIYGKKEITVELVIKRLLQLVKIGKIFQKIIGKLIQKVLNVVSRINIHIKNLWDINFIEILKMGIFIIESKINLCIDLFGSTIMGKLNLATIFTTKITTNQIMQLKIFRRYQLQNTQNFMPVLVPGLDQKKINDSLLKLPYQNQKFGMLLKKDVNGIKNMELTYGKIKYRLKKFVNNVERVIRRFFLQDQNGVEENVKPLHYDYVVEIQYNNQIVPLYDLTIEKHHCYFANGILVSNCDSLRYLALGYKEVKQIEEVSYSVERVPLKALEQL